MTRTVNRQSGPSLQENPSSAIEQDCCRPRSRRILLKTREAAAGRNKEAQTSKNRPIALPDSFGRTPPFRARSEDEEVRECVPRCSLSHAAGRADQLQFCSLGDLYENA